MTETFAVDPMGESKGRSPAASGGADRLRALYLKETAGYFNSPVAYILTVAFTLITGYFFAQPLFLANQSSIAGFVEVAPLLLVFFIPAVTMRQFAEEIKTGTLEILATLPVTDLEILLAKYLASMTLALFALAATVTYPATIVLLGRLDWGAALGSYAGLALTASVLAAAGLWASTLSRNQVVAFILAFLVGFSLFLFGKVHAFVPPGLQGVTDFLGLDSHLDSISRGLVDTRDLLYYASLSGWFLFLAHLNLGARRWR